MIANSVASSSMKARIGSGRFGRNLRTTFRLGCNLLVFDAAAEEWGRLQRVEPDNRVIDIWWRENQTGELMLLLGHLVTRSEAWDGAKIRVLADQRQGRSPEELADRLRATLEEYRIDAEVVVGPAGVDDIVRCSRDSSLVFLPFSLHGERFQGPAGELSELLRDLPIAVLTLAAQDVDLGADPDEEGEREEESQAEAP